MAADLGSRGITVNTLSLGPIETDMNTGMTAVGRQVIERTTALGRFGRATDISSVAAFLASVDSGFVTAQYIEASGGLRA